MKHSLPTLTLGEIMTQVQGRLRSQLVDHVKRGSNDEAVAAAVRRVSKTLPALSVASAAPHALPAPAASFAGRVVSLSPEARRGEEGQAWPRV